MRLAFEPFLEVRKRLQHVLLRSDVVINPPTRTSCNTGTCRSLLRFRPGLILFSLDVDVIAGWRTCGARSAQSRT